MQLGQKSIFQEIIFHARGGLETNAQRCDVVLPEKLEIVKGDKKQKIKLLNPCIPFFTIVWYDKAVNKDCDNLYRKAGGVCAEKEAFV